MAWSPDLDCEFDSHQQVDQTAGSTQDYTSNHVRFSHVGDSHTEISLALLRDSTDQPLKPFVAQAFGFSSAIVPDAEGCVRIQDNAISVLPSVLFIDSISSRAPPSLLL